MCREGKLHGTACLHQHREGCPNRASGIYAPFELQDTDALGADARFTPFDLMAYAVANIEQLTHRAC